MYARDRSVDTVAHCRAVSNFENRIASFMAVSQAKKLTLCLSDNSYICSLQASFRHGHYSDKTALPCQFSK